MRTKANETSPLEKVAPTIKRTGKSAAGIPAIISTAKHSIPNMGVLRSVTTLSKVNKYSGFDCPGCAWPDPDHKRSFAEFCENGAKSIADEATKKRADSKFWSKWKLSELSKKSDQWLNSRGRITSPLIIKEGSERYEEISWQDAYGLIGRKLSSIEGPDEAIFYTSGRTSNEAAFLWQLLARSIGTNNLPDCSNMCHESSGVALTQSIGIGKGTVKLDDFEHADLIIVVGQNPGTNHPRMLTALRDAKKSGASIISINPLIEKGMVNFKHPQNPFEILGTGTNIADEHVRVKINGDQALFRGFAKVLIGERNQPSEFIQRYTSNFEDYKENVEGTEWKDIAISSGVSKEEIVRIGRIISKAKSIICCWAMGLTQHKNSVATIQEITNLLLIDGNIGRKGAGLCPVRGHSNVQGDRTVGINHNPSESFQKSLKEVFGIKPIENSGYDSVESVKMMNTGKSSIFLSMGGNFLSAMSDTHYTASALRKCDLTVHISTKPNRSHLIPGKVGLILPCLGRTETDYTGGSEQFVTVENSMGIVHKSVGGANPASPDLRSEVAIIVGIAKSIANYENLHDINWDLFTEHYDNIRQKIELVVPGFEGYNERCRQDGGFYLPNPPRDYRIFETETGKATFIVHNLESISASENEYVMMTIRSHDQYNTTIFGTNDRYRGIQGGRRIVLMSKNDMDKGGFFQMQLVTITSKFKEKKIRSEGWRIVNYDIPDGNVATYFPESNVLIPLDSVADYSNTPTSKSVCVSIEAES